MCLEEDEMEMPCPCQSCGEWFDLNDGFGSRKWYPGTVICKSCHDHEVSEVEDDYIEEGLLDLIEAGINVRASKAELKSMGRPYKKDKS